MNDKPETAEDHVTRIRAEVGRHNRVTRKTLMLVESALVLFPSSAALWCLRGDLIQLGDDDGAYSLEDAANSYLRASSAEPANPEAFESLGHFYDAVMDDPARAVPFFRQALALGSGQSAQDGLVQALEQLRTAPRK